MNKTNKGLLDEQEVRRTIGLLFPDNRIFEIRVLGENFNLSGYFNNADTLLKAFDTVDLRKTNVYMTLQTLNEQCYARSQRDRFMRKTKAATSDTDVKGYSWFFIDMDPERISDTSSTDEQLRMSFEKAKAVEEYLAEQGFTKPIKAISGNGAHLLYPIRIKNDPEGIQIIKSCLEAIAERFTDEAVKIDTVNFNPSRICKLYGTLAQKGSNSAENPYRMSRIIEVPEVLQATPKDILVKVAGSVTVPQPVQYDERVKDYRSFDIEDWLRTKYPYSFEKKPYKGAMRFVLEKCPFNHNHKAPDSFVILQDSGAIGFKCSHNSCSGKTWRDMRLLYEPDAYSYSDQMDREITLGWQRHNRAKAAVEVPGDDLDISHPDPNNPVFLTMNQILAMPEPENEYLRTGIDSIDSMMKGLQKGAVSVLSGLRGAAKSTVLSQIMLSVIDDGHNVICYSGELSSKNFSRWMLLQAAGARHTVASNRFRNSWVVDSNDTRKRIADWMEGHFWLFNNNYGNKFSDLAVLLQKQANDVHADFIVLDNLMALDIGSGSDKYEAQTQFVWELKNIAKVCNVHILFVAHPRKASGFLRLDDISGSGNISNIVDNAFIIHRHNTDFDNNITSHLGKKKDQYIPESCTNIIEICKDRENGTQDFFIPLWYEPETKRLKNRDSEHMHYGWETDINDGDDEDDNPF